MKARWIFKMIVGGTLMVACFTALVMWLWNLMIPELFNGPILSFWQALGLLILSKILFGGGGHAWRGRRNCGPNRWSDRFKNMTPEQREQMKEQWQQRCSMWKSKRSGGETATN